MHSFEFEESLLDESSDKLMEHKDRSSKERLNDDFIPPKTPETLVMTTPTKLIVDSNDKIREELQTTLEKHGIERENARDFFQGLVRDKDFKKLFMASVNSISDELRNNSDDDEFDTGPMTRSKLRNIIQNSPHKVHWVNKVGASKVNLPKFADIPLPDHDDDDDEYRPLEESFERDLLRQCVPDPSKDTATQEGIHDDNKSPPRLLIDIPDDYVSHQHSVRPDVISKRTRSKHSLESTSLDVLEAAFNPPDVTDDMYDTNIQSIDDYDWQKWLSDLVKSDLTADNNDDDNVDDDPDFMGLAELERSETEEINDSAALEVPRDELFELLKELENPKCLSHAAGILSSTPIAKPIKKKLVKRKPTLKLGLLYSQINVIEQQLQQHVQLLLQANLLCRNTIYDDVIQMSGELIHDLHESSVSQMTILGLQRSYLSPCNLEDALKLVNTNIPPSEPIMRLHRIEKLKRHVPLPFHVAERIGNSKACMYPELLPVTAPLCKSSSQKMPSFLFAEDCLLALGLSEMKEFNKSKFELISHHLLPGRTPKQLSARARNVVCCRNVKDLQNPITIYHKHGVLPSPNTRIRHVHSSNSLKPVQMTGDVPCWVHALKPIYETNLTTNSSGMLPSNQVTLDCQNQCNISSTNEFPTPCTSVTAVTCIGLCSTSTSAPVTLQKNQISMFQTYYSVDDQESMCNMKTTVPTAVPEIQSNNTSQSVHGSNTLTSQSLGMITTSKVQPSKKYGRRKSAGKSIKRMRKELVSSSSSSDSEDDSKMLPKPQKCNLVKERVKMGVGDSGGEDKDNPQIEDPRELNRPNPIITTTKNEVREIPPVGGYLQKLHPRLLSKKSKMSSKDAIKIKTSAQRIKFLEDDANVLLDPRHDEKERIFATGYLARVQLALQAQSGKYEQFLSTLSRFTEGNTSPVGIFKDITELLRNWPDLIQGFVPFLSPAQARECGLAHEKLVYVRARGFLRQLELQFADNQEHLDRILDILNSFSKTAVYNEEEMMSSILNLLKGYPYLQDEFLTFFDSQPPPKIFFDDDFEEVDLTDDTVKDPNAGQFELVSLNAESHDTDPITVDVVPTVKKSKKRSVSQCSVEEQNAAPILPNITENKENIYPSTEPLEDAVHYESESDDVLTEDEVNHSASIGIPPNMAIINEDALSSSPFKRITGETEPLRPRTPTGIAEITSDTILYSTSSFPPCMSSNSCFPVVPPTPGKIPVAATTHDQELLPLRSSPEHSMTSVSNDAASSNLENDHCQPLAEPMTIDAKVNSRNSPASNSSTAIEPANKCSTSHSEPAQEENNQSLDRHKDDEVEIQDKVSETRDEKWTRDEDEVLLTTCQQGISAKMFADIAERLGRSVTDVEARLHVLCNFFDESDEDVETCSDSSAS